MAMASDLDFFAEQAAKSCGFDTTWPSRRHGRGYDQEPAVPQANPAGSTGSNEPIRPGTVAATKVSLLSAVEKLRSYCADCPAFDEGASTEIAELTGRINEIAQWLNSRYSAAKLQGVR